MRAVEECRKEREVHVEKREEGKKKRGSKRENRRESRERMSCRSGERKEY